MKTTARFCWHDQQNRLFCTSTNRWLALKLLTITTLFFCLNLNHAAQAGEFSVAPMMISLDGKAGQKQTFEFTVRAQSAGQVVLNIYKLKQMHSGHMEFLPLNKDDAGLVKWITLNSDKLKLKDNQSQTVKGKIKIPRGIKGSHLAAIMIEEVRPNNAKRVSVTVRYAIVIDLKLAADHSRLEGHLAPLRIEQREEGSYIVTEFTNLSSRPEYLKSVIDIRNEEHRLIERISLLTESAQQRKESKSRVFPKTTVGLKGLISKPLKSGILTLSARNRFGRSNLPRGKTEIEFNKNQSTQALGYELAPIIIEPTTLGFSKNEFIVSNPYTQAIKLRFPVSSKDGSEHFQFRPRRITLAPNESNKIALTQHWSNGITSARSFPVDLAIGDRWHDIQLQTVVKHD